ncbi:MAG: ATP-binding protein [Lachnospiraceae bacterium]|nr:ATP-binding protein [Lachnospiraceae bacterium]
MQTNPFTLSFGTEPNQYISRFSQTNEVFEAFTSETPSTYVYMITGIRGAGKTVMLSNLCNNFSELDDWIVLNVIPDSDILKSVLAKLASKKETKKIIVNAKIDLSLFGIGVSVEKEPIYDIETAFEEILKHLSKNKKKLLIAIDEIVNNEFVRIFAATFQLLIRQKLPVFLLATGLYDNIYNLQNEKTLTFLYRAPKITLEPLSINSISRSYEQVLKISTDDADQMAKLTKGYAFAYQVLGFLFWDKNIKKGLSKSIDDLLPEYDEYLESYVYEKIWSELSPKEREIVSRLSEDEEIKVADIREQLDMTSGQMSVYRDRLKKRGIINATNYGYMSLKLPRFKVITRRWI